MIRSMTAYASVEHATPFGSLCAELRSVNHRHLELGLRLADDLRLFEPLLRQRIGAQVARGKLELSLRWRGSGDCLPALDINAARLAQLADLHAQMRERFPDMISSFTDVLAFPGVVADGRSEPEVLRGDVVVIVDRLVGEFLAHREREGGALAAVIAERFTAIAEILEDLRALAPEIRLALKRRYEARFAELKVEVDASRLEQELLLLLQRADVDEELDRLAAHVAEARHSLKRGEAVGRRLDFLLQEFNREANTLGSKAVDMRMTKAAIELKVLIEQIREQVQNLE